MGTDQGAKSQNNINCSILGSNSFKLAGHRTLLALDDEEKTEMCVNVQLR